MGIDFKNLFTMLFHIQFWWQQKLYQKQTHPKRETSTKHWRSIFNFLKSSLKWTVILMFCPSVRYPQLILYITLHSSPMGKQAILLYFCYKSLQSGGRKWQEFKQGNYDNLATHVNYACMQSVIIFCIDLWDPRI